MRGLYDRIVTSLGGTPKFHLASLAAQASSAVAAEVDERGRTAGRRDRRVVPVRSPELDAIRMLTNYEMDSTTPFAVLLIGQPTPGSKWMPGWFPRLCEGNPVADSASAPAPGTV